MVELIDSPTTCFDIALFGEIDISREYELRHLLKAFEASTHTDICINLAGVTFMDSSGLRTLTQMYRAAGKRGGKVAVTHAAVRVEKVLHMTGLDAIIDVRPDTVDLRGSAKAAATSPPVAEIAGRQPINLELPPLPTAGT